MPGVLAATTPDLERTWSVRAPSPVHATPLPRRSPRLLDRGRLRTHRDRAWTRRGARRGGRWPDDGDPHPARRSRTARVVGRDRGPPQERRPGDRGRAPPGGRLAGSDPVREGRRAPDAVRSGPRPVRPAPGVRRRSHRRARRWRGADRLVQGEVHAPTTPASSSSRSSPSIPRGSSATSTCCRTRTRSDRPSWP